MRSKLLFLTVSLLMLTGCGPKRIDGSSEEAFKKSLASMSNSLSEKERKELSEGVMMLALDGMNIFQIGATPGLAEQRMRDNLNGKSFDEIRSAIVVIRQERADEQAMREKERSEQKLKRDREEAERDAARAEAKALAVAKKKLQIETEIAELELEKTKAESDALILSKFQVSRSRFYFTDSAYRKTPTIELTVTNGLPAAVSRVYFSAVLSSPGRSIPWIDGTFNYTISGGLEPGESATWKLAPNMFGEWGKAPQDRDDMVLTATLTKVDGVDGKALFDSVFNARKKDRLVKLKETVAKGDFAPSYFD